MCDPGKRFNGVSTELFHAFDRETAAHFLTREWESERAEIFRRHLESYKAGKPRREELTKKQKPIDSQLDSHPQN